ncbi:hypothetical protein C8F04DRAFT_605636 [Mycena alexandri]|uniref:Secreted protein n=1 Tax=Mycena alexandri TaxID=1745969 RepID=A0AAD6SX44_9AGAR|nr:hypothetical protein C8F04DRAFT_605636 [Mycena alexandri]
MAKLLVCFSRIFVAFGALKIISSIRTIEKTPGHCYVIFGIRPRCHPVFARRLGLSPFRPFSAHEERGKGFR